VIEDGVAHARAIEIGLRGIATVEVVDGLEEDTQVIAPIPEGLEDGRRVRARTP
jgi:hypothetical protein